MSKNTMKLCYPYGRGVSCICDNRGHIYKCFASRDTMPGVGGVGDGDGFGVDGGEALLSRDDRADGLLGDEMGLAGMSGRGSRDRGLDERTEIILAATFLVLIVLAFIR